MKSILVPRGHTPFGQHQESRPLERLNTTSLRFTENWLFPEVVILGADQKEHSLWEREWPKSRVTFSNQFVFFHFLVLKKNNFHTSQPTQSLIPTLPGSHIKLQFLLHSFQREKIEAENKIKFPLRKPIFGFALV